MRRFMTVARFGFAGMAVTMTVLVSAGMGGRWPGLLDRRSCGEGSGERPRCAPAADL